MQYERWFPIEMTKGQSHAYDLGTLLCSGDENSVRVGVEIRRNKIPEAVSGTIKGYVTLPNGLALMPFDGSKSANKAWIDLPEYALGMAGRINIAIRSFDGAETTVLLLASATVRRVDADQYYDPDDYVGDITDLIEDAEQAAQDAEAALAQATQIVSYAEQTGKTDAQKAQARTNIGAASTSDVSDVKSAVTAKMVLVKPVNKWNTADVTVGYVATNGNRSTSTSYQTLNNPIAVTPGDVVRFYANSFGPVYARFICAYDATGTAVQASGSSSDTNTYTVPTGIYSIIPSVIATAQNVMVTINEEVTAYTSYVPPYYMAGDGFCGPVPMSDTDFDDVYLDWTRVNRLNPATCETGKTINVTTGVVSDSESYFVTDYMPIREGETLYFFKPDGTLSQYENRYAAFDSDKNVIASLGHTGGVESVTQSGDMAYIRAVFVYLQTDIMRTPNGVLCLPSSNPRVLAGYGAKPAIKSDYLRPVIWVNATDTEAEVIGKLVNAYKLTDCDVYFERATYTFGEGLANVSTTYSLTSNEIPIGNGCRYFFNGATLTATIDLSQHPATGNDEFYCNFLGCQRRPSSYEMHDGVLIATDTRYVVHDESSALEGSYKHLYQNMEMHYHTSARQEEIRKCIGGGTGASGVVEIVGCKFTTDAVDSCVSFHGNGTDVEGAQFDLSIRDSWFSNGMRAGSLSASQTARLYYVGNSAAVAPSVYAGWTTTAFLNEVRS